jgi:hypothetical protein
MTYQQAPMRDRAEHHRVPFVAAAPLPRWRQLGRLLAGGLAAIPIMRLVSVLVLLTPLAAHAQCPGHFSGTNVRAPGEPTTLDWSYPGAEACTIRSLAETHSKLPSEGHLEIPLRVSTTFELNCQSTHGSASANPMPSCYVTVPVAQSLVKILALVAEPNTIVNDSAATATLRVTVTGRKGGAGACKAQAIGSSEAKNFVDCPDNRTSFCLSAAPHYDTAYRVTCEGFGDGNTDERDVQVRVVGPVGIAKFTATPPTVANGAATTLEWNALNAKACRLDPGAVEVLPATGVAHPAPKQYTAYRLTCEGWDKPVTTVQAEVGVAVTP